MNGQDDMNQLKVTNLKVILLLYYHYYIGNFEKGPTFFVLIKIII